MNLDQKRYVAWKNWGTQDFGLFSKKESFYFKLFLKKFGPKKCDSILEIGFGNGSLAGWIKNHRANIAWSGFETNPTLTRKAKTLAYNVFENLPERDHSFDLIVMLDVLEHIEDTEICNIFGKLRHILNSGGHVIARVPNASGPFGLANQMGDPTHITPISATRLAFYLADWEITQKSDIKPIWTGNLFKAFRELLRAGVKILMLNIFRFALAPQPRTCLDSNLILILRPKV